MCAMTVVSPLDRATRDTFAPILAGTHDRWMAEADKLIGPVTDSDATFMQRWAAVRYVWDELPVRLQLEQELLDELHPFIPAEIRARLSMQLDRLHHLHRELRRPGSPDEHCPGAGPDRTRSAGGAAALVRRDRVRCRGDPSADVGYAATSLLEDLTVRPLPQAEWGTWEVERRITMLIGAISAGFRRD